jgi:hypothetical protein
MVPPLELFCRALVVPSVEQFQQGAPSEVAATTIEDEVYHSVKLILGEGSGYESVYGANSALHVLEQPCIGLFLSTVKAKAHTECVSKSESWNPPAVEIGFETAALKRFDQIQSGL